MPATGWSRHAIAAGAVLALALATATLAQQAPPETPAAAPEATPPAITSLTLRGARVTPGAHRIHVRCGRSVSPTIWLIAPRNQIFDGLTWLSNGTAGVFGY